MACQPQGSGPGGAARHARAAKWWHDIAMNACVCVCNRPGSRVNVARAAILIRCFEINLDDDPQPTPSGHLIWSASVLSSHHTSSNWRSSPHQHSLEDARPHADAPQHRQSPQSYRLVSVPSQLAFIASPTNVHLAAMSRRWGLHAHRCRWATINASPTRRIRRRVWPAMSA